MRTPKKYSEYVLETTGLEPVTQFPLAVELRFHVVVRKERFELSRQCWQRILSPSCLPFHHSRIFLVDLFGLEPKTVRLWAGYSNQLSYRSIWQPVLESNQYQWSQSPLSYRWTNGQYGSPNRTRTCDQSVNSRLLYLLSYRGIIHHILLLN